MARIRKGLRRRVPHRNLSKPYYVLMDDRAALNPNAAEILEPIGDEEPTKEERRQLYEMWGAGRVIVRIDPDGTKHIVHIFSAAHS